LPDISKWDTNKVDVLSNMFYGCSSLTSLPDISIWNINNDASMIFMLRDCENIIISKITKEKFKTV